MEFALVFPLQLVIVMFILEMSMILVARSVVSYAAYCAAHAEIMGQDPVQAAAIALIPLGDANGPNLLPPAGQTYSDNMPGWGYQPKWSDVRGKVKVYRLFNDNNRILNRVNIIQTDSEYHKTLSVSQHNVEVEVEFPLKLLLPLSFFEMFMPADQLADFQAIENQVLVNIDGEYYFVLRETCRLPNKGRVINTTLELQEVKEEDYGD